MVTKLAIILLLCSSALAQLPDAPKPQPAPTPRPAPHFFQYRKSWQDPPLRTNRQTLNRKFILLHVAAFAAVGVACHNPRSGEECVGEIPAVGAITAFDFLVSKYITEMESVEAPPYIIQHYIRSALK